MNALSRELHVPTEADVEHAMRVLSADSARRWEAGRQAREAEARQRMADWLALAEGRAQRAADYELMASDYPPAHRLYQQYTRFADEQRRLSAEAMRLAKQEASTL
jgi:hypothetical protein